MDAAWLDVLCSPDNKQPLRKQGNVLVDDSGLCFEIRHDIPCLICPSLNWRSGAWQQFYDATAWAYDPILHLGSRLRLSSEERIRKEVLAKIEVPANGLIVDIGCGSGGSRAAFHPDAHYLGLDLSLNMLRRAQEKCASRRWEAFFVQVEAASLPVRAGQADLVLAMGVLQHAEDPQRALREMARVARPKAQLWLVDESRSLERLLTGLKQAAQAQDRLETLAGWCETNLSLRLQRKQILGEYFILALAN